MKVIHDAKIISRSELAKVTGLTGAAITLITRELIEAGLIREEGQGESDSIRGRRPINLMMQDGVGYVLGLEVTKNETIIGLTDLKGNPELLNKIEIDLSSPSQGLPVLIHKLQVIMSELELAGKKVMGIGISLPALLDSGTGVIKKAVNFGKEWAGYGLKQELARALQLPVYVENNAKASVLAERIFGDGTTCKNLAYVHIGYGISAGIMMDDRILHGGLGHAGEIGHVVVEENGPLCNCGNYGCLEAICGLHALIKQNSVNLMLPTSQEMNADDFLRSALCEGSYAWLMMRKVGRYVGIAISYIISLYNPDAVFIGGKTASAAPVFMDILLETVKQRVLPEVATETRIEVSRLNGRAAWTGACALAVQGLLTSLDSPLYSE